MVFGAERKPSFKFWLECNGKPLLGKGGALILHQVDEDHSISKAAKDLGMSYRYVWNYLRKIDDALGKSVTKRYKGGKLGGGGAQLTPLGRDLLAEYDRLEGYMNVIVRNEGWEVKNVRISARNVLPGKVKSIEKGEIMAKVKIEITVPATVTALVSKEAAEDLRIKVGDQVEAIIKATEVMVGKQ